MLANSFPEFPSINLCQNKASLIVSQQVNRISSAMTKSFTSRASICRISFFWLNEMTHGELRQWLERFFERVVSFWNDLRLLPDFSLNPS
jgi:hypothetical protein